MSGGAPDTSRISPTAHYTSYVWYRNGLSHGAFATAMGRAMYTALQPANAVYEQLTGRPNLEMMLLARHRVIDHLLATAIERREIGQVIEIAGGLSARGWRFARRYPELLYVEGDLPAMAAHKRELVQRAASPANHIVAELNALAEGGDHSLASVAERHLDPTRGTAIITEGLLNYFPQPEVEGMFARFAACLRGMAGGVYLSDLNVRDDARGQPTVEVFRRLLQLVARGGVHLHYGDAADGERALVDAGFDGATLHRPASFARTLLIPGRDPDGHIVRIIESRCGSGSRRSS